jgi:glutamate/tyrosine decarboxylase-like PLP-dependent enzyme
MYQVLQDDLAALEKILQKAEENSLGYLRKLDVIPCSHEQPLSQLPVLPPQGMGTMAVQQLFSEAFLPNIVASSGSRYWGFVTGGTTPAAIVGDWLTAVYDQNTQAVKGHGDISAILEKQTISLLLQLFHLPDVFMGTMVTGATMSNFTGLAVARQWLGKQLGKDIAREGVPPGLKIYAATPHSSAIKALSMLGLGSTRLSLVPVLEDRECMDVQALEAMVSRHPDEPFILIASGGTVNTVDFDNMQAIAALKNKYRFWWHIDAAFGGFAACSPEYASLLDGWEQADSITVDNHKWLNVPYDSAVIFTRNEHAALQVATFQNSNAPYLGDPLENFTYLNYGPENSRRFRALPAWFTLMAYGREGYRAIVENNSRLAKQLGNAIAQSEQYRLAAPVRLNTVCFTLKDDSLPPTACDTVLDILNRRGKVFMTPTVYKGIKCIRAALVNWRTTTDDVELAVQELHEAFKLAQV